jgi:hypothetical protein
MVGAPFQAESLLAARLTLANHGSRRNRRTAMNDSAQHMVIVDLRIPFVRLVLFFIKLTLAAIPAAIIVGLLLTLVTALIAAVLGDSGFLLRR